MKNIQWEKNTQWKKNTDIVEKKYLNEIDIQK